MCLIHGLSINYYYILTVRANVKNIVSSVGCIVLIIKQVDNKY